MRPCAIPANACGVGGIETGHGCDRTICRCIDIERQVEGIAVRFGIQQQREPVPFAQTAIDIDHEATVGDIGTAGDIDALRAVAGDTGSKGQIVYFEPVDRDVEPGQYGIVFFAWQEFRSACESSPASGEAVDFQPVGKPAPRIPIDFGARYGEKDALWIGQAHIVKDRRPVEITLYSSDPDVEAVGESAFRNAAGDEAFTKRRVENDKRPNDQKYESGRNAEQPLANAPNAKAPPGRTFLDVSGRLIGGHQKA